MDILLKSFFKSDKSWLVATAVWFLVSVGAGVVVAVVVPQLLIPLAEVFREKIGEATGWELVRVLFTTNATVAAVALAGGVVAGIAPLIVITVNALLLGYVAGVAVIFLPGSGLENALLLAAGILPHGIFEIPALLIASAAGLRLGLHWVGEELAGRSGKAVFKQDFYNALRAIPIILILLIIAAVVESFVTGFVLNRIN